MSLAANTACTIIPCLRYRDAPAAIAWLCDAFGSRQRSYMPRAIPCTTRS